MMIFALDETQIKYTYLYILFKPFTLVAVNIVTYNSGRLASAQ